MLLYERTLGRGGAITWTPLTNFYRLGLVHRTISLRPVPCLKVEGNRTAEIPRTANSRRQGPAKSPRRPEGRPDPPAASACPPLTSPVLTLHSRSIHPGSATVLMAVSRLAGLRAKSTPNSSILVGTNSYYEVNAYVIKHHHNYRTSISFQQPIEMTRFTANSSLRSLRLDLHTHAW